MNSGLAVRKHPDCKPSPGGRGLHRLGEAQLGQELHLVEVEPVVRDDAVFHRGNVTLADTNLLVRGGDGLPIAGVNRAAVRPREYPSSIAVSAVSC